MNINRNVNTSIITDNNLEVLKYFSAEEIVNDIDSIKAIKSKFVVFNDVLRNLKHKDLLRLLEILEKKGIHFVNVTSNIEEVLYAPKLIVISEGQTILEGNTISVLKEEKILKRLGFGLPFMMDLSIQLNYYGLIDSIFLDEGSLVDKLW